MYEVARTLGLGRATTHRYLASLAALGYLSQDASRRYLLGHRAADFGLAALATHGFDAPSRPLRGLRDATGLTAALTLLDGSQIMYVAVARSCPQGIAAAEARVGLRVPATRTAAGRAVIAQLPAERRASAGALHAIVDESPRGRQTVTQTLDAIREQSYATSVAEPPDKARSIAAAIEASGQAARVAVSLLIGHADAACCEPRSQLGPLMQAREAICGSLAERPRSARRQPAA